MVKFIKKNQKQLLAVFGVLLMIVFIIPTSFKNGSSSSRRAIGHIGADPVYADEKTLATNDWLLLSRYYTLLPFVHNQNNPSAPFWRPQPAPYTDALGGYLSRAIPDHADLYLLLQKEANRRGIVASPEEAKTVIANELLLYPMDPNSGFLAPEDTARLRPMPETIGQDSYDSLVAAVTRFLPVQVLYNQVAESAKVTHPMWEHEIAQQLQEPKLSVVDFSASQYTPSVPAPTQEQIQAQYDKYKQTIPGQDISADDPLNFGYKLPERVKIEYLKLDRKKIVEQVKSSRKPYDWEVDERVYYYAHQADFVRAAPATTAPATAPATRPTTQTASTAPSTAPTSAPVAASQPASTEPTTRPFVEVQSEIASIVMQKPADDLANKIVAAITTRMAADYESFAATSQPTSSPSTQPATGIAAPGDLDTIALDIQKQFGVLPDKVHLGDFLDVKKVDALPDIGQATTTDKAALSVSGLAFDNHAASGSPLALFQPSPGLKDASSNQYVVRVIARSEPHAPPLNEIADQVKADFVAARAYEQAQAAAKAMLEAAKKSTLTTAAIASHHDVKPVGPVSMGSVPGIDVSLASQEVIASKATDLLKQATPTSQHPMTLLDLPADKKVLVVQLADVVPMMRPSQVYGYELTRTRLLGHFLRQSLARSYFDYDAVRARLGYVEASGS